MFQLLKSKILIPHLRQLVKGSCFVRKFETLQVENLSTELLKKSLNLGQQREVNHVWLRENCRCKECYNYDTDQRTVLFHRLKSKSFEIENLREDKRDIEIKWCDHHVSTYDKNWLKRKLTNEELQLENIEKIYWDASSIKPYLETKKVDYECIKNDKLVLKSVCEDLYKYGFVMIEGVPSTVEGTGEAAEQISNIKDTFYGRTWSFSAESTYGAKDDDIKDTYISSDFLGFHTDGSYMSEPPAFNALQCLTPARSGGETILVDGFKVAKQLKKIDEESFHALTDQPVNFCYKDRKRFYSFNAPTLELENLTGEMYRIRYNHFDRSAHILQTSTHKPASFYKGLHILSSLIESSKNVINFTLMPGMLLILDNWRMIHGRTSFEGNRTMGGCFLDRDQWMSHLRM